MISFTETARANYPVYPILATAQAAPKGKELVEQGGGKTVACEACHGQGLKGNDNIPRIAGEHPIYTVRQLHWFKDGSRNGADAGLMKGPAETLNDDDIIAIAAYLGSLEP